MRANSMENCQAELSFILFSPQGDSSDVFKENINLLIQDLSEYDMNLKSYTELSVNQIKEMMSDTAISYNETLEKRGRSFQKMIFSGTQSGISLMFMQYYWVFDNTAYVLTLTSTQSSFETIKEEGEKIMDSFGIY